MVTEVSWDGNNRRSALETAGLPDAGRWKYLIEQVLAFPPRYRAAPGSPVYVIHASGRAVLVGEENLIGPRHDLVTTIPQTYGQAVRQVDRALLAISGCRGNSACNRRYGRPIGAGRHDR